MAEGYPASRPGPSDPPVGTVGTVGTVGAVGSPGPGRCRAGARPIVASMAASSAPRPSRRAAAGKAPAHGAPGAAGVADDAGTVTPEAAAGRPRWLVAAAVVVGLEGLALLAYAAFLGIETVVATPEHRDVATGSATFLALIGLALCAVGWALWRRRGWAAGAGVTAQLISVAIAWYMLSAHFWLGGIPLAVGLVVALVGLFAPSTREALGR